MCLAESSDRDATRKKEGKVLVLVSEAIKNERAVLLLGTVADSEVLCYDMTGKTILYDQPLKTVYMM